MNCNVVIKSIAMLEFSVFNLGTFRRESRWIYEWGLTPYMFRKRIANLNTLFSNHFHSLCTHIFRTVDINTRSAIRFIPYILVIIFAAKFIVHSNFNRFSFILLIHQLIHSLHLKCSHSLYIEKRQTFNTNIDMK